MTCRRCGDRTPLDVVTADKVVRCYTCGAPRNPGVAVHDERRTHRSPSSGDPWALSERARGPFVWDGPRPYYETLIAELAARTGERLVVVDRAPTNRRGRPALI